MDDFACNAGKSDRCGGLFSTTCFDLAAQMRPCPIGATGACCCTCSMGPCRATPERTGVCGATVDTIAARNFARSVAVGASAHADHGRSLAEALLAYSEGRLPELSIADEGKLRRLASLLDLDAGGLSDRELAGAVASAVLGEFGRQQGDLKTIAFAPAKRRALWTSLGLAPRGIDREAVETMHRTHAGTDQSPEHLLDQSIRTALADGWGGSLIATELADALFGTPRAVRSRTDLGVLDPSAVNVVVHGHEPLLPEMLAIAAADQELEAKARDAGASGINLSGICCTANEALMRRGIPSIGGATRQEEALLAGAVDVMAVDVQCIFQSLAEIAKRVGTALVTTSPKARMEGAHHIPLGERPLDAAKVIVAIAVERFKERRLRGAASVERIGKSTDMVGGFSLECIESILGGRFLASLRPLNDAVIAGYVRGIAAVVGCSNPRVAPGEFSIARELIRNNVLVVQTGCTALDSARRGLMWMDEIESAGPLLREICRHLGIPPVLHMGSCVDNSRILAALSKMVLEGGLGDDISDLPIVGLAPEWMSEKALAIGAYFAASGVPVFFGYRSPVAASEPIGEIMNSGWARKLGGSLEFEPDSRLMVKKAMEKIDERRELLGITGFGLSGDDRLGDRRRKRQLIWWQKRLSYLLS